MKIKFIPFLQTYTSTEKDEIWAPKSNWGTQLFCRVSTRLAEKILAGIPESWEFCGTPANPLQWKCIYLTYFGGLLQQWRHRKLRTEGLIEWFKFPVASTNRVWLRVPNACRPLQGKWKRNMKFKVFRQTNASTQCNEFGASEWKRYADLSVEVSKS